LFKNEAITANARKQVSIRQMELDWYSTNYDTMGAQAAMFAGFAFEQVTQPVPEGTEPWVEIVYVLLTCCTLGFELCVCMSCTFCCIFGKGLALRGPHGAQSVHVAVDNMQAQQRMVFAQFVSGIVAYLASHVIEMWIYTRPRIALTVSIPLVVFGVLILYYIWYIVDQLLLDDGRAVNGKIAAWAPYERIDDLDTAVFRQDMK